VTLHNVLGNKLHTPAVWSYAICRCAMPGGSQLAECCSRYQWTT